MIDWIAPKDIVYSVEQIKEFLLPMLISLQQGYYPCDATGYTPAEYKSIRILSRATFVQAVEIAAELTYRISRVPDGQLLIDLYTYHQPEKKLIDKYKLNKWNFWLTVNVMLQYVKGKKRKHLSWDRWFQSTDNVAVFKYNQHTQKRSFKLDKQKRELELVDRVLRGLKFKTDTIK